MRILLVDDNEHSLQGLAVVLTDLGHEPVPVANAEKALDHMQREFFPLVITDIRMPGMDGLELLGRLKASKYSKDTDVVIITGHGDMETAVDALRKGAYDYLNKPINARELAAVVDRSAEHQALLFENREYKLEFQQKVQEATQSLQEDLNRARQQLRKAAGLDGLVAESMAMQELVTEAALYHSDPSVPVLIEGETGTGKEVLARLIHFGRNGNDKPFVPLNCAAIPDQLFESELFGHEGGAYTGSTRKGQPGKLEAAGRGSVFMDEVAELPLGLQPKLLRVFEDRTFYRVGGVKRRDFEARIICAANRELENLVEKGAFRRDLYHRLKVGYLRIPPLRERSEDIGPLAEHFLQREARRKRKNFQGLHPDTVELLTSRSWPGNVRELENVIERAVLSADGELLMPEHLALRQEAAAAQPGIASAADKVVGQQASKSVLDIQSVESMDALQLPEDSLDLEALNESIIRKALVKFSGNKSQAARYLGLSRYALHRRLQKMEEIDVP